MSTNENQDIHLGKNVKCLMRAFGLQQYELAKKAGISDNQLSNLLHKAEIEEESLEKLAKGLGNGVTPELIKAYNHEDTVKYIINNYTQNVEEGGTGTLIPNQDNSHTQNIEDGGTGNQNQNSSTFQEGSSQTNNYVAEQAFEFLKENAELKTEIMRLRMKYEPEAVEAERKNK